MRTSEIVIGGLHTMPPSFISTSLPLVTSKYYKHIHGI